MHFLGISFLLPLAPPKEALDNFVPVPSQDESHWLGGFFQIAGMFFSGGNPVEKKVGVHASYEQ